LNNLDHQKNYVERSKWLKCQNFCSIVHYAWAFYLYIVILIIS